MTDVKEEAFKQACRDILERHKIRAMTREEKIDAAVRAVAGGYSVEGLSRMVPYSRLARNEFGRYVSEIRKEFAKL